MSEFSKSKRTGPGLIEGKLIDEGDIGREVWYSRSKNCPPQCIERGIIADFSHTTLWVRYENKNFPDGYDQIAKGTDPNDLRWARADS